ncbi:SDR family oxidoreductase [Gordonia hankookensis]|uniref:SDR family oxidoreductase n=1 Tax=Gordonia hankookensis TaxID=589403 RepID=A0ABR7WE38_9ACTN|nr:NAD-dependent epimerase/dehydratase family protein [Gordonia hankookensis]MBD1321049.1 SDR family oxidoreductase [Gordonia hankookensis]
MKVVILGASGEIGRSLSDRLRDRGVDVLAAQRSSGVDAYTGTGLVESFAGADAVVDCTNIVTTKAAAAIDFYATVAANVAAAAIEAGVDRVICLSIINAADPAVNAKFGYYQGKAAQEEAYRGALGADRLTVVRSAQWYELARQMMGTLRLGPLAAVPHMRCRPLSSADAAAAVADVVMAPNGSDVEVAGPEVLDLTDIGKAIARRAGAPRWVIGVKVGGQAIRDGGLLPDAPTVIAPTTLEEWLDKEYAA